MEKAEHLEAVKYNNIIHTHLVIVFNQTAYFILKSIFNMLYYKLYNEGSKNSNKANERYLFNVKIFIRLSMLSGKCSYNCRSNLRSVQLGTHHCRMARGIVDSKLAEEFSHMTGAAEI